MNPFDLDATGLMIWGLVAHLVADWPLQNDWMANNKAKRWVNHKWYPISDPRTVWYIRHPAAYVHAGIHGILLGLVFGFWPGVILAIVHLVIDCRWVVVKWSQLIKQTQPKGEFVEAFHVNYVDSDGSYSKDAALYDVGTEVRFWTDQVFHILTIAIAALVVM